VDHDSRKNFPFWGKFIHPFFFIHKAWVHS